MPFVAGDDEDSCALYSVEIPGDDFSVVAFSGALAELAKAHNWEALGTWTAANLAEAFRVALNNAEWDICSNGEGEDVSIAIIRDEKASGVAGGTFTSGAWRVRALNAEVYDPDAIVTLADDQFTLIPGTYVLIGTTPAYKTNFHRARVYDITADVEEEIGTSETSNASDATTTRSRVICAFTIEANTTYELQHQCASTYPTTGLGQATSIGIEVYSEILIVKVA